MPSNYPDSTDIQTIDGAQGKLRRCSRCRQDLPVDAFRRRWKGREPRHTVCASCHKKYLIERRTRRRNKTIVRFTTEAISVYQKAGAAQLGVLVALMARHFGGVQGLARSWKQALDAAQGQERYPTVVRSLTAWMHMMVASQELEKAERERCGHGMTHEQLIEAQAAALRRLLQREPELVLRAAEALGWTVTPPNQEGSVT